MLSGENSNKLEAAIKLEAIKEIDLLKCICAIQCKKTSKYIGINNAVDTKSHLSKCQTLLHLMKITVHSNMCSYDNDFKGST